MADNAKWYVVHTYSGYENTVAASIEKAVENRGLRDLIQEVSIPLETVTEITDNGPKTVERKVFPGYVLVKMVMTDDTWHLVRNIRGATGFVGSGNKAIPLTDEEIQAAYFRAEEAYGWFSRETRPCGEKTQTIDGWLYYPVEYPGMENLADLRAYLRGLFSEELVDALLASGGAHPLYQDVDGTLYVLPTSRERDESKGQADIQIKPYGQAGYSVIVEVDLLADGGSTVTGVESYAFPYEFLEDRWVFTDFHLIY